MGFSIPEPMMPHLAGYTAEQYLGRGGEAYVWRATDAQGRVVAVKHHYKPSTLRAESDALQAVRSSFVVRWFTDLESENVIVREYIGGRKADVAIDSDRNGADWRRWLRQSATALRDILDAQLAPNDFQLVNIMISDEDGRAVVIDLGHAVSGPSPLWLTRDWLRRFVLRWAGQIGSGSTDTNEPIEAQLRAFEPALADVVEGLDFGVHPMRAFVEQLPSTP